MWPEYLEERLSYGTIASGDNIEISARAPITGWAG